MIALIDAGYRYPSASEPAVSGLNLEIGAGELVLLTGPTGCGKSTVLRLAAGLLGRHGSGEVLGRVLLEGEETAQMAPSRRVRALGFVAQEPQDQLVAGTVGDELAFGMESAGMSSAHMEARIPELLAMVGLEVGPERGVRALSGGQTQRLVTGAALAAGGRLLLLDEPLAMLDPLGAQALLGRLRALADGGVAVLLVEHRLEACWDYLDRVVVMEAGAVVVDAPRAALGPGHPGLEVLGRLGLSVPGLIGFATAQGMEMPTGGWSLQGIEAAAGAGEGADLPALEGVEVGPELLFAEGLRHRYPGADRDALLSTDLRIHRGERLALVGANGVGKSTLLAALNAHAGRLAVAVPQDPDLALFCATVEEELAYGPVERRSGDVGAQVHAALEALSLGGLEARAPQALSRGQRLRVAVAAALSCAPSILILDEPTAGQDELQVERMMAALRVAMGEGALVFATHDLSLVLRHATRVILLEDGRVVADGAPGALLSGGLPAGLALSRSAAFQLSRGRAP